MSASAVAGRLNVVLIRPQIAANTGNIGRTCLGFGAKLHLVRPLGFDLSDKAVKRAGLDYWKHVDLNVHESVDAFVTNTLPGFDKVVFLSKEEKYGCIPLTDCDLRSEDLALVFGSEIDGIDQVPSEVLEKHVVAYLPMDSAAIRSYNLSNTVSIGCFEAHRQALDE